MKIRIYDDSIRLRLDRSEVDAIGVGDTVEGRTHFSAGPAFVYRLINGDSTQATFDNGCIELCVAQETAQFWATTETEVSIIAEQETANGPLKLLIEKDFECLDPREGEDQSNRFVNPKA